MYNFIGLEFECGMWKIKKRKFVKLYDNFFKNIISLKN